MTRFIGIVLATALLGATAAGTAAAEPPGLLLAPAELDLGRHEPGTTVRRSVWIVNAGSQPVELLSAAGSCGCTTVAFSPGPLAARSAVEVPLEVKAPRHAGAAKTVSVTFAVEGAPPLKLPLRIETVGEPGGPVAADPPVVDLGAVRAGTTYSASVRLVNTADEPRRIESARAACGCTRLVDFAPLTVEPGAAVDIALEIDVPEAELGRPLSKDVRFVIADQGKLSVPLRLEATHPALRAVKRTLGRTLAPSLRFEGFRLDAGTVTAVALRSGRDVPVGRVSCQLDDAGEVVSLRYERVESRE